jgi:hypothetical protein
MFKRKKYTLPVNLNNKKHWMIFMKLSNTALTLLLSASVTTQAYADESTRLSTVEKELNEIKSQMAKDQANASAIKIGGVIRFGYGVKDYNENDKDRGGDIDFDVFRLDLNGTVNGITLSAQYRWYQYMNTVHHADLAYQFNDNWQGKIGITKVPFGNLSYNSNSFFFSTNFYVGLEDDYDSGLVFKGDYDKHDIRIGYFKNDEMGGIDGYLGDTNKNDRYSYDVIGTRDLNNEGIWDAPGQALAEDSTLNLRYTYHFPNAEVGVSALAGGMEGVTGNVGNHNAYAFHVKSKIDNVGIAFQYTDYEYDLDNGADFVTVGAYAFNDTIPTSAEIYNLNVSYDMKVNVGPITDLRFYNDYNVMTNKSGNLNEDTVMNITGIMATAGSLYTLIDFASGKNQPFIGGSLAGDSTETNNRLNVNFGFYF